MAVVYALVASKEPETIRYIGRTKFDTPDKRLATHKRDAKAGGTYHIHNWIRKVEDDGDVVIAIILDGELTWEESATREIYWIAEYKARGYDLTNMTSGGDGAPNLPEEVRLVMSAKARGKGHPQSEETRRKISEAHKGRKPSDEIREKYRKAKLGKKVSAETKAKISASSRGKPKSEATKAKMSAWQYGRVLSDEHKEKVSKALKEYYAEESGRLPGGRKRKNKQ